MHGFWLNTYLRSVGDRSQQVLAEVMGLLADGTITPHSGEQAGRFGWKEGGLAPPRAGVAACGLSPEHSPDACTRTPAAHPAGQRFPLEQVREAIKETQAPRRGGKCFLEG